MSETSQGADAPFMRRAVAAARANLGVTEPNPCVGCVVMRHGEIVAEAATGPGGRPHAEEQALTQAGGSARGATVYVTLEPCAERSSGGFSCSELLAAAGVARVVIACEDPHPFAAGRGIARLRAAGIACELGLLADEAAPLVADWVRRHASEA